MGMLLTDDHQRYCSGALINNSKQDGAQYFLTANHCVFADVSYFIIGFDYQFKYCQQESKLHLKDKEPEPEPKLIQGLRLVASWDQTDFALLLVKERIPDSYNVYLAGVDPSPKLASNVYGIHHPSGDVKKISSYHGTLLPASWNEAPKTFHVQVPSWTFGVTERGSSGSPLFNQEGLIVGHLRGGQSSCEFPKGYDLYGAVAWDWEGPEQEKEQLKYWLAPGSRNKKSIIPGAFLNKLR